MDSPFYDVEVSFRYPGFVSLLYTITIYFVSGFLYIQGQAQAADHFLGMMALGVEAAGDEVKENLARAVEPAAALCIGYVLAIYLAAGHIPALVVAKLHVVHLQQVILLEVYPAVAVLFPEVADAQHLDDLPSLPQALAKALPLTPIHGPGPLHDFALANLLHFCVPLALSYVYIIQQILNVVNRNMDIFLNIFYSLLDYIKRLLYDICRRWKA